MGIRLKLEQHPLEQVAKWRRVNNLVKRLDNKGLLELEEEILKGDEDNIRAYLNDITDTREKLLQKARKLNVKNYGRMTKGELINAIEKYERDKIVRQKHER